LAHNAKVYVAARSQEKVEAAIKDLKNSTGKEAIFLKLDLGDLKSVKAAAEEYLRFVFRHKTETRLTL
jgi:retinol dehydrogenase-12